MKAGGDRGGRVRFCAICRDNARLNLPFPTFPPDKIYSALSVPSDSSFLMKNNEGRRNLRGLACSTGAKSANAANKATDPKSTNYCLADCLRFPNVMLKKYLLLALVPVAIGTISCSSNTAPVGSVPEDGAVATDVAQAAPFDYSDYADVLSKYVSDDGVVDYTGLQADREALDRFNTSLGEVSPATYQAWSGDEQLAFLINAYNSLTLASIIDNHPVKSIKSISGVWDRRKFLVVGSETTLNGIEHATIRKQFTEPRIHFAVNCASFGCPVLRNEPFVSEALDEQLEEQTQVSLDSEAHFRIDREKKEVYLSSVFKWFGEDWEPGFSLNEKIPGLNERETAAANFVSQYVSDEDKSFLSEGGYKVKFIKWDWDLNGK